MSGPEIAIQISLKIFKIIPFLNRLKFMMLHVVEFIAMILLLLVTGVFWGPWFALSRSMKVFSPGEFTHIAKTMADNLANPMRVMLPLCILFMALTGWLYPQRASLGFYLNIAGLVLIIVALLVTVLVEVPIVKQIIQWTDATIPEGWETLRDRWVKFHLVRVLASIAAFAVFTASLIFV